MIVIENYVTMILLFLFIKIDVIIFYFIISIFSIACKRIIFVYVYREI